jgi:hypothetical protein
MATTARAEINTKSVSDRRSVRYGSVNEVLGDLDTLDAAMRAGTLRTSGNWTPAQIYNHLAAFIEYAFDGYPEGFRAPPAVVRFVMKFMKKKYCFGSMPVGLKIPRVPRGTVGQDDGPPDAAMARLRRALQRIEATAPTRPSHLFGRMTHEEWKGLNLRHCELHLSFLHPR